MFRHIGDRKIIGEEEILEAGDRDRHENEDGHAGVAGALCEQNAAGQNPDDARDDRVDGRQKARSSAKEPKISTDFPRADPL